MPSQHTKKRARDRALFDRWARLPDAALGKLPRPRLLAAQAALQGHIVLPGEAGYDTDRRLFNPVFDAYPLAIVYCTSESDVGVALALARDTELPFTLRSGGHCTAGFSAATGALLIDLSGLDDVSIDSVNLVATVRPGCPWATFDKALDAAGLHVPGGECGDVCVAGYMQGGGYGFTSVTFGMNCDNVFDMRVMLADGSIVGASQSQNTDLWWAMRGGTGGNFGVLLQVRYQLRPLGQVFGWALIWPLAQASDRAAATHVLMTLQQQYMLQALDPQLNLQVSLCFQPGTQPGLPPNGPQAPYLMLRGLYVGGAAAGMAAIQPLCALPGCVVQWTKMDSFVNLNNQLLNLPYAMPVFPDNVSWPYEDKASRCVTAALAPAQWQALLDFYVTSPNTWSYAYLEFYGGAINAQPPEFNAYVHRNSAFNAVLDVFWLDASGQPAAEAFLAQWLALWEPVCNGEIYQNYPRLGQADYGSAYWGSAQAGLYAVKVKYDPDERFRFAQQVRPLMAGGGGPGPVIILPGWLQQWLDQPIVREAAPPAR